MYSMLEQAVGKYTHEWAMLRIAIGIVMETVLYFVCNILVPKSHAPFLFN
jgi:hypothetical protein